VFKTGLGEILLRLVHVIWEESSRIPVVEAGAGIEAARIGRRERPLDQSLAERLTVQCEGDRLAEVDIAVQLADGLSHLARLTPAIAGEVRIERVANCARTELQAGRSGFLSCTTQRFHEVF